MKILFLFVCSGSPPTKVSVSVFHALFGDFSFLGHICPSVLATSHQEDGRLWWSWGKISLPDSVPNTVTRIPTPHRDCVLSHVQPFTSTPPLSSLQSPNPSQALVEKGTVAIHVASSLDADLGSQDLTEAKTLLGVLV